MPAYNICSPILVITIFDKGFVLCFKINLLSLLINPITYPFFKLAKKANIFTNRYSLLVTLFISTR